MIQLPCSARIITLYPDSVRINRCAAICLPKVVNIRIIGSENAVDDCPVNVRGGSVKRNFYLLTNFTTRPVCSDQIFGFDVFHLFSFKILQHGFDRIRQRTVARFKILYHCAPLNIRIVSQQISNIYSLDLPLSDGVYAAEVRIALRRWIIDQFFAIFE